MCLC
jgi:phage shock protein A